MSLLNSWRSISGELHFKPLKEENKSFRKEVHDLNPIKVGWIDYSSEHRNKVLVVLDALSAPEAVDELGIGLIRDGFINLSPYYKEKEKGRISITNEEVSLSNK